MEKLKIMKGLFLCLIFVFAAGLANAQQVTDPSGPSDKADQVKQEMVTKNAPDQKKLDNIAQQKGYNTVPGFNFSGSESLNREAYQEAKQAWIQNNQALYRSMMQTDASKRGAATQVTAVPVQGVQ